jgi:chemotaxis protein methyltransferase CheR
MSSGDFDRLTPRDFARLASFIHGYSGIKMPLNKLTMLEGRLRRRLRDGGFGTFGAYCRHLFDEDGLERESVHLIDAVTTNKTEFFREPDHFRLLDQVVLPNLLAGSEVGRPAPIKVWSAASSTGAEPYTIAMVLAEFGLRTPGFRFQVLATDICTEVLEIAVSGIYPETAIEPVPPALRPRHLRRGKGGSNGLVRIAPELRSLVRFGRLNLIETPYRIDRDLDVIFCRNILIYFDKPTQEAVLRQICEHLRPGGYLFLGHSETLAGFALPLRVAGTTLFERI